MLLDDPSKLDNMQEGFDTPYREIVNKIKFEDAKTDYSYETLTAEERTEIALYHSIKQDPFFKHYLYNHLRQFAEEQDEGLLNFPVGPFDNHVNDHVKFDRINLFDFRRTLPQKERLPVIDAHGNSWGHGKRKSSVAVARVRPGSGISKLQYFHLLL